MIRYSAPDISNLDIKRTIKILRSETITQGLEKLCRDIKLLANAMKFKTGNGILNCEKFQRNKLKILR